MNLESLDPKLRADLESIYEETMWLAKRPNVTPGRARAWYTHVMAESVKRRLRRFTGQVSAASIDAKGEPLILEHYLRIQTSLTLLVERHRREDVQDHEEFLTLLLEFERVHIVTRAENYAAMRAKGDYELAKIVLRPWAAVPVERQRELWATMLKARVANASEFRPA